MAEEAQKITVNVNGASRQIASTMTGQDLFADRNNIVAVFINGVPRDVYTPLHDGDAVLPIAADSDEGLAIMRHSTTHVMAQAVQDLYPGVKLGIGPVIDNGFYYDFDVDKPFTPDDLKEIEKRMQQIIKEDQRFVRRAVTEEEGRAEETDQPYKLELIGLKEDDINDAEKTEIDRNHGELTFYDNVRKDGTTAWKDLCRGPHLPSTKYIGAFKLQRTAAAYWRGDENNPTMQRIYGTAWNTKADLKKYLILQEEAAKRDHRKIGSDMDLFSFPEELGPGLAVFHPKGATIINAMEDYSRKMHRRNGYSFVQTPHLTKQDLYVTSGHLNWYHDDMFPPMHLDEVKGADGTVKRQGQDYYMKPMNCPMHNLIFKSRQRSYRELPLRLFEFGTVYRYEKSGEVHGLTRMRGFTQDDSHIYCTREQMKDELTSVLNFVLQVLRDFGLTDFYLEFSTKDPDKYVGSDEVWEEAERALREVGKASGLEFREDPGGAAFYGPKISVEARDAIGRNWQISTIQLDFNEPHRFGLQYVDKDGQRKEPVMIHRALFGSVERFLAILIENYAGAFPAWLAPVQVEGVSVTDESFDYISDVCKELVQRDVRAEVDNSDDRFGKKIRNAAKQKVPLTLIAGDTDRADGCVSFRFRDGSQLNGVKKEYAEDLIEKVCGAHEQCSTLDDFVRVSGYRA
ncbi:MAG: threonine--tRNA ligase [Aeriscardovia sp.]|nr:threonine--tRNA ligase [Aeriscardovia sp.]MBQ5557497.1 threonine--tRNA ligase [Aeriscardovia sp.]